LATYKGVTLCCGVPILSMVDEDVNWGAAIQITVYAYLGLILMEVVPVMREVFPLNLLNPLVGFFITFAMFFYDRITVAYIMWGIKFTTVVCEYVIYRLKVRWHKQRDMRVAQADHDLLAICEGRKRRKQSGTALDGKGDMYLDDSSFHEETELSYSGSMAIETELYPVDKSQFRETRLLRERRGLRQAQKDHLVHLGYHFVGVTVNILLACVSILLIAIVGRNGGLCIVDMQAPNIFARNQLEMCSACKGREKNCMDCPADGTSICYYPYY